jgi:putative phosphoserine phosphatase/1-acylglycerol-3-phosphate O-acyltransferase
MAREMQIEHIVCTELEVVNGMLSGNAIMPLCYGTGKLERAKRFLADMGAQVEDAVVYSDSVTDLPLLEAARTAIAVNPDPRLRRVALQRGWRVEVW